MSQETEISACHPGRQAVIEGRESKFPTLKAECRFYPFEGAPDGPTEFILCTPEKRQFRVSESAKELLLRFDGTKSLEQILDDAREGSSPLSKEELRRFVESRYVPLGIFENMESPGTGQDLRAPIQKSLPFLLHWDLIPQRLVAPVSRGFQALCSRFAVGLGLACIVGSHYLVYTKMATPQYLSGAGLVWVMLLALLSILLHELGHASAVSRYGGTPGKIGFGLCFLIPAFYADVSEIWRFSRKRRMVVDIGGVYFQQLAFAAFALVGLLLTSSEFVIVCRFIDLMCLLALNPVFRFDGYWLLSDWLGLPNLHKLALGHLKGLLGKAFGRPPKTAGALPPLRRHAYWTFFAYALLCNLFLFALVWLVAGYIHSATTRLPAVVPGLIQSLQFAFKAQDIGALIDLVLTLFFIIAFPATIMLGIGKYAMNLTRFFAARYRAYCGSRAKASANR